MSEVSIVGIIPSRYGSTRLPGKALKPILGKPMIQRVHEQVSRARGLSAVYVATDDERIARLVESFGGKVVMTSPEHPSGTDRLAEAAARLEADIVVNIQGDQPFVDPLMIEELVQPLLDDPSLQMSTLIHALTREGSITDPSVVKVVVDRDGNALYFSRSLIPYPRENIPHPVYEHIGLYAYRKEFLIAFTKLAPTTLEQVESLEQLRALEHGYRIRAVETKCVDDELSGFSIDTPKDIEQAEAMLRERGLE